MSLRLRLTMDNFLQPSGKSGFVVIKIGNTWSRLIFQRKVIALEILLGLKSYLNALMVYL